jgi:hypothetical protein
MAGEDESDRDWTDYPLPPSVTCPFCGERDTRIHSPFGRVMSVSQYYCRRCRTVFEWVKWEGRCTE